MNEVFKSVLAGCALCLVLNSVAFAQDNLNFFDDFQGSSLNPAYKVLNRDQGKMALTEGEYLLLVPTKDQTNILEYVGKLPEHFSATIRVQEPPGYHSQYVALRIGDSQDNAYVRAYYREILGYTGLYFSTNRVEDGGEGTAISSFEGEMTGKPFYLRLMKTGVEYKGLYSPDGAKWKSVGKRVLIGPRAGLFIDVAAWNTAPQTPIKIDSFEIKEIIR